MSKISNKWVVKKDDKKVEIIYPQTVKFNLTVEIPYETMRELIENGGYKND